ncbi:MAG: hypothetical protein JNG90_19520 [Planctomycetaceae bacterium]|nr:hypothetical protein [Planctomycetaceae bacterium]
MSVEVLGHDFVFNGQIVIPAVGSPTGIPFCKNLTGSATVQGANGGGLALALTNANEAQNGNLYMGDVLPFPIADIKWVDFWAKLSTALGASALCGFGLASARNATLDSITERAMFRIAAGASAVTVETDNNVVDSGKIATGLALANRWKHFRIDFEESTLGRKDVRFFMDNERGQLQRVAPKTVFSMDGAGNLQLLAQIQKTATTDVGTLNIARMRIERKFAY